MRCPGAGESVDAARESPIELVSLVTAPFEPAAWAWMDAMLLWIAACLTVRPRMIGSIFAATYACMEAISPFPYERAVADKPVEDASLLAKHSAAPLKASRGFVRVAMAVAYVPASL